jgi:cytochrome c551/c552
MRREKLILLATVAGFILVACNNNPQEGNANNPAITKTDSGTVAGGNSSKGIGRFKEVPLTHPLDSGMVAAAKLTFDAKCSACHKLTDEKLVGPGWKGVTDRHTPEWIMNFITNTQVMLDKDLAAQAEVVTCLVRMPNQDLTDEQARQMLELMRQNDGKN